jgi:elongation factor 1-gamma
MAVNMYYFDMEHAFKGLRCRVAAAYAGVPLVMAKYEFGKDNEADTFLRNCSPLGRVPVLETPEGYIFESNAILRYFARRDTRHGLYGRTDFEAAQIDSWVDFVHNELDTTIVPVMLMTFGVIPMDAVVLKAKTDECLSVCTQVDAWLEVRSFLVAERLSIADIAMAVTVATWLKVVGADERFQQLVHLHRYVNTCMAQPTFVAVLEKVPKQ